MRFHRYRRQRKLCTIQNECKSRKFHYLLTCSVSFSIIGYDLRPDKRLECRGFLKMLQIVSWKGLTSKSLRKCRPVNNLRHLDFRLVSSLVSGH